LGKGQPMIRGFLNNNPGNLRDNPNVTYIGEIGRDSKGFSKFDTAANGLRALGVNATYIFQSRGAVTLRDLGNIWAPAWDNPLTDDPKDPNDDYGASLAKIINDPMIGPDTPYPYRDIAYLRKLIRAIVVKENGWAFPYSPSMFDTAALTVAQYRGYA